MVPRNFPNPIQKAENFVVGIALTLTLVYPNLVVTSTPQNSSASILPQKNNSSLPLKLTL
jgi:hypothetical protein